MGVSDTAGDKARRLLAGAPDYPKTTDGPESSDEALQRILTGLGYAVLEVADAAWLLTALLKQPGDDDDKGGA
jgi:hypothetical protein